MHKHINKNSRTQPTAHRPLPTAHRIQPTAHRPLPTAHSTLPTRDQTPPTQYVELHARSAFSFLRGAATPEELIAACAQLNMPAMALLDNDGVYGAARFHLAAQKVGIKAHIGAEIQVSGFRFRVSDSKPESTARNARFQIRNSKFEIPNSVFTLPLMIRNRTGYQNLCRLITLMKMRVPKHAKPGECAVSMDELAAYADGLVCLTGAEDGPLSINSLGAGVARARGGQRPPLNMLIDIFGRE